MGAAAQRTPRERSGTALCPRDEMGRLIAIDPLARFAEKCAFDPTTGCVLWKGGTTAGRGNTALYGSFWHGRRRWFAHRWAAVHIHKMDVDGLQVGHCCPGHPNTLCVQHVEPVTMTDNLAEQRARLGGVCVSRSTAERQHWLFVQMGFTRLPEPPEPDPDAPPFYSPPAWLRPFTTGGGGGLPVLGEAGSPPETVGVPPPAPR